MGCTSVSNKKQAAIAVSANQPSFQDMKNYQAPASLPINIKIAVNFFTETILNQSFTENSYVKDIINEIKKIIPSGYYTFKCQDKTLPENSNEKIIQLLKDKIDSEADYSKTDLKIVIDVILQGLPNLPRKIIKQLYRNKYLAKPLTDPFEIAIFDKNSGKIHIESLTGKFDKIAENTIYSQLSAYCSGRDHLYISGGVEDNVTSRSIWDIDLANKTIYKSKSSLKSPRKLHSMIYIPDCYVFIVGGLDVKEVEFFDISKKEIFSHSKLNEERIEPALMIINDTYLYAFTGFYTHKGKFLDSFERINLRTNAETWELIKPNFQAQIGLEISPCFSQKFFAVSLHTPGSVIFLGGIHGTSFEHNKNFCHVYNYENNTLSLSNVPHVTSDFGEKSFYPLDIYNNLLIPYINRDEVSIIRYARNEGIKKIGFEFDSDLKVSLSIYRENEFRLLIDDDINPKRDVFKANEHISKSKLVFSELMIDNYPVNPVAIEESINVEKPYGAAVNYNNLPKEDNVIKEILIINSEYNDVRLELIQQDENDQYKDENDQYSLIADTIDIRKEESHKIDLNDRNKLQNGKFFTNDGNDFLKYKFDISNYLNNILYQESSERNNIAMHDVIPNYDFCPNNNINVVTEYI